MKHIDLDPTRTGVTQQSLNPEEGPKSRNLQGRGNALLRRGGQVGHAQRNKHDDTHQGNVTSPSTHLRLVAERRQLGASLLHEDRAVLGQVVENATCASHDARERLLIHVDREIGLVFE